MSTYTTQTETLGDNAQFPRSQAIAWECIHVKQKQKL